MPYLFSLPTPGPLLFQSCLSSPSHPQLPYHATTARHALRVALKRYKKSTRSQRQDELLKARNAAEQYLSWLVVIIEGAGYDIGRESNAARPEIEIHQEIEAEWSAVLFSSRTRLPHLPASLKPKASPTVAGSGRTSGSKRVRHPGFAYELAFTLTTYAFILSNLARSRYLHTLYASRTPAPAERTASLQSSTRDLQLAASIHAYISTSPFFAPLNGGNSSGCPPDVQITAQSGLKSLCLAEATLLSIAKDDGYLFACIQLRNERDTDWMIKAPDIPRVRTLLFARICVRAAELASEAEGAMMAAAAAAAGSSSADKSDGIIGRRSSTGHDLGKEKEKSKLGFRKWKEDWREKREERRLEKGAGEGEGGPESDDALVAGDDAGRMEEVRILEWLSGKWEKLNNTMNTQHIPPHGPLMSQLPSGRDILSPLKVYIPEGTEKGQIEALRGARVSPGAGLSPGSEEMESSSDEEVIRDYF
ncbi:hypothetical protein KEM56_005327 [Ascosphaera pollenicola]|nr:hypothetical protein KEM56_005327 [Ascosphaera pollenicola]